mmetsp:Transcript_19140/g.41448  ORF Transcript_19140/g.41448 Transcript_19140/m.41448 type:complete len:345 (-) Transcript_19140:222-1256(-)
MTSTLESGCVQPVIRVRTRTRTKSLSLPLRTEREPSPDHGRHCCTLSSGRPQNGTLPTPIGVFKMMYFSRSNSLLRRASTSASKSAPLCIRPSRQFAWLSTLASSPLFSDGGAAKHHTPTAPVTISIARRFIHHHKETPISKVCPDANTALKLSGLKSGDTIAVGGFGLGGIPETLLNALSTKKDGPTNLTVASLTAGVDSIGLGKLFEAGKVKRMISSYVGENKNFERMFFTGELEVELVPQGTIAARLRAAGNGMPAIFTPAGAGTMYANGGIPLKYAPDGSVEISTEPRPTQTFDGKEYVMEYALHPDVSFVKAYKADTRGNLIFRGTSQNANPDCPWQEK